MDAFFTKPIVKRIPKNFFIFVVMVAIQRLILIFAVTTECATTCSAYLFVSVIIIFIICSVTNSKKNCTGNDSLLRVTELLMPLGSEKLISDGNV